MNKSKAVIISIIWIAVATVSIFMKDTSVLSYAVIGTAIVGFFL